VFTKLRGASEHVLDRGEGDVAADDGILIPGRVIHVEQAGVGTDFDTKADSLVAVGPPPTAEVAFDAGNCCIGSGEPNRAPPFKSWMPAGEVLPGSVPVVDWIADADIVVFVARRRDEFVGDALGLFRN
jgi:hypothetical protein